jgi:hypothetical protein
VVAPCEGTDAHFSSTSTNEQALCVADVRAISLLLQWTKYPCPEDEGQDVQNTDDRQ